jgi:hypothetical protein
MKNMIKIVIVLILAGAIFSTAYATEFIDYSADTKLDSVYDDDVFLGGNNVRFDATVTGDLFVFSWEVVQSGNVGGGFNAFAGSIQALNNIDGSFRGFGNEISLNAPVGRNALIFGNMVTIGPQAVIRQNLEAYCQTISFEGEVYGGLDFKSCCVTINGEVHGDVYVEIDPGDSDANILIGPETIIEGDLIYSSHLRAEIDENAVINGNIKWDELEDKVADLTFGKIMAWIISLKGYLIMNILISMVMLTFAIIPFPTPFWIIAVSIMFLISGNIVLSMTKEKAAQFELVLNKQLLPSMGVGLVIFFLVPILILISIIAIPLAMVLTLIFGVAAFIGSVYVTLFFGRKFYRLLGMEAAAKPGYLYYSVGTILITLMMAVPYLGYLISTLMYITGLGGLYVSYLKRNELKDIS